jgi:anti-sigma regulatory factor (Ser/Thr protein kinase)
MTEEAELLASEVVTNALIHGDSDVDIHVRGYPERVRVEVRDSDPHLALPVSLGLAEDEAEGGRGLVIVSAMASAWGNSPSGRGKTVWFELRTPRVDGDQGSSSAEGAGVEVGQSRERAA